MTRLILHDHFHRFDKLGYSYNENTNGVAHTCLSICYKICNQRIIIRPGNKNNLIHGFLI